MATQTNGIDVLQGVVPADIAAAPVRAKVVEMYDDSGNLFSAAQVAQMESGGGQVLGYFSIGEAENYRSYFSSLPSSVLGPVDPAWPGDYEVAYWSPQWLTVSENYIQTMINQGYNGACFDVVGEAFTSWAQQNAPGGDAQGAMVKLIQELGAFAHAQNPNFKIWINSSGAEPMLSNPALINAIDGVFEEQLFYQNATQATSLRGFELQHLAAGNVTKAGKPVVAIEYISGAAQVANVEIQAKADGFGYYIANPNLALNGVDTQGFAGLTPPPPTPPTAVPVVAIASTAEYFCNGHPDHQRDGRWRGRQLDRQYPRRGSAISYGDARRRRNLVGQCHARRQCPDRDQHQHRRNGDVQLHHRHTDVHAAHRRAEGGDHQYCRIFCNGHPDHQWDGRWRGGQFDRQYPRRGSAISYGDARSRRNLVAVHAQSGRQCADGDQHQRRRNGNVQLHHRHMMSSQPTAVPTVAITSAAARDQAAQTITGTVDVADAGSTVNMLDGTKQVATATVGTTGAWSANVTLNQGANVLTATDTNTAGTGKSSAITDTLTASTP